MEIQLWYKNTERSLVSAKLITELKDCGFSVTESGDTSRDVVCIAEQEVFWDVSDRIESHVCATLYLSGAEPATFPMFFGFFRRVLDHNDPPVREASLDVGPAFEFPFFSLEEFRNSMPPLLMIREHEGEEWEETAPGEESYWEKALPKLHYVSSKVLAEPDIIEPEAWAEKIGATLQACAQGLIWDCGWSDWCLRNGLDFAL
jgi:hypothetical protein